MGRKRIVDININKNHGPHALLEMITVTDNNKCTILLTRMLFVVRQFYSVNVYIHFGSFKCLNQSAQSCELVSSC